MARAGSVQIGVSVNLTGLYSGLAQVKTEMAAFSKSETDAGTATQDLEKKGTLLGAAFTKVADSSKTTKSGISDVQKAASDARGPLTDAERFSTLLSLSFQGLGKIGSGISGAFSSVGTVLGNFGRSASGVLGQVALGIGKVTPLIGAGIAGAGQSLIAFSTDAQNAGVAASGAAADTASLGPVGIGVAAALVSAAIGVGVFAGALGAVTISLTAALAIGGGVALVFGGLAAGIVALGVSMGKGSSNAAALASSQKALTSAQAGVLTSTNSVGSAHAAQSAALSKYGANSQQYATATRALQAAQDRLAVAQQNLTAAQQKLTDAQSAGSTKTSAAAAAWGIFTGDVKAMAQTLANITVGPATLIIKWLDALIPRVQAVGVSVALWFGQNLPRMIPMASAAVDVLFKAMDRLGGVFQTAFSYVAAHQGEFNKLFSQIATFGVSAIGGLTNVLISLTTWWFANWSQLRPFVEGFFATLGVTIQIFIGAMELCAWVLENPVTGAIRATGAVFSWLGTATHDLGGWFSWLGTAAQDVANTVGGAFSGMGTALHNALLGAGRTLRDDIDNYLIQPLDNFINNIDGSVLVKTLGMPGIPDVGYIPGFANGGIVPGTGSGDTVPAMLTPGEVILNRLAVDSLGGAAAANMLNQKGAGIPGLGAGVGGYGGQCVVFVEKEEGVMFPVAIAAQMTSYINSQTPKIGEIFVSTLPPDGHTGIINGPNSVIDSNWNLDEMVHVHPLSDIPDIAGYIDLGLGLPAGLPTGTGTASAMTDITGLIKSAVGGAGLGNLPAWLGSLPNNLVGAAAEAIGNSAKSKLGGAASWVGNSLNAIGLDNGGGLPTGLNAVYNGTGSVEMVRTAGQENQLHQDNVAILESLGVLQRKLMGTVTINGADQKSANELVDAISFRGYSATL